MCLRIFVFLFDFFFIWICKKISTCICKTLQKGNLDARKFLFRRLQCLLRNLVQVSNVGQVPHQCHKTGCLGEAVCSCCFLAPAWIIYDQLRFLLMWVCPETFAIERDCVRQCYYQIPAPFRHTLVSQIFLLNMEVTSCLLPTEIFALNSLLILM